MPVIPAPAGLAWDRVAAALIGLGSLVPAILMLVRYLTPEGETSDMATDTDAGERMMVREAEDARPDGGPAAGHAPASDSRGEGWSSFWITDHDSDRDALPPADDGISRVAVADAVQCVPDRPETFWRRGDLVSFDNGRTRLARVRLVGPCARRPGVWTTDLVGVDLHEVYFRRAE